MTTLTIEMPPDMYERLLLTARKEQKPVESLAREWLAERIAPLPELFSNRERARVALRAAGLLVEPSFEQQKLAAANMLSSKERAALANRISKAYPYATPLSEIIIAEREER